MMKKTALVFVLGLLGLSHLPRAFAEPSAVVAVTPTVSTPTYASGDQVGTVMTFTPAVAFEGQALKVVNVTLVDKGKAGMPMDIYLFNGPTAPWPSNAESVASPDNRTLDISDAQMGSSCIGHVSFIQSDYVGISGSSTAIKTTSIMAQPHPDSGAIYAVAVGRATIPYTAATDLVVKLGLEAAERTP